MTYAQIIANLFGSAEDIDTLHAIGELPDFGGEFLSNEVAGRLDKAGAIGAVASSARPSPQETSSSFKTNRRSNGRRMDHWPRSKIERSKRIDHPHHLR